jgi:peptide/nickel transport system substrate-binding protein
MTGTASLADLANDLHAQRVSRRAVLKRAAALGLSAPAIATLLAACGGDDDTDEQALAPAATAAAPVTAIVPASPRAVRPRVLTLLWWQAPTMLNPHLAQGHKDYDVSRIVLEPLADFADDGTLVPFLAAEVPSLDNGGVAPDGLSVTWKLREGVTWHDGAPFTSRDVRFTWEFATQQTAVSSTAMTTETAYGQVAAVETPDEHTVIVRFREPTPRWSAPFTDFNGRIVPEHLLRDFTGSRALDAPYNLQPVGTGPFTVREFRPGDVVLFERYDGYWDAGKPFFDEVAFRGGGDATSAAYAVLQSGEADYAWNVQLVEPPVLERMAAGGTGTLLPIPGSLVERILVNFSDPNVEVDGERSHLSRPHPFLSEHAVRSALALACDRDTLAEQLYGPAGQPTANILVAPERFVSPNTSYAFDPDRAAALLAAAGWTLVDGRRGKDGQAVKLVLQSSINLVRQKTQELLKQAFDQIGIPTEVQAIDAGVFFAPDPDDPDTAAHFYADLQLYAAGSSVYPLEYLAAFASVDPQRDIAQRANSWTGPNTSRWVNAEFNQLYVQAQIERDPERQIELFIAMNDLIVADACAIPLVQRASVAAHAADLEGIQPSRWASDLWRIADWRRSRGLGTRD